MTTRPADAAGRSGEQPHGAVIEVIRLQMGLSDFRLWSYEAVDKFVVAVHLAWAYIERRFVEAQGPEIRCCGDLIGRHREEQAEAWLEAAVVMTLEGATCDQVLQRFLRREPQAN
jgi:hypothetical protein